MTDGLYVPLCTPGFRRSADRSSRGDSQSFRDCRVDRVSPRAVESNRAGSFALCISSPAAASSLSFSFSCLLPRSIRPLAFSFVNPPHRYPATRTMASTVIPTAILLLAATQAVMCNVSREPKNFFPKVKGNLTKIVWAHAVNSKAELEKALSSDDIMMLEGDVVIGKLNDTDNNSTTTDIPIMAHPPGKESDLSFEEFLNTIIQRNGTDKGIKLDFKTIEAFEKSKPILAKMRMSLKFPVFINADIIPGPVNASTAPVNAKDFLKGAMETIPECILSVGWTTRYGKAYNITEGRYLPEQMKLMTTALTENEIKQSVTYPVRAGIAANDIEIVKKLLNNTVSTNATLTIWSSEGDFVKVEQLTKLIKDVGVDKVYLDVPESLQKQLNLSGASALGSAAMLVLTALGLLSMLML